MQPCPKDCPNRCADPNCHNITTCERWAAFQQIQTIKAMETKKRIEITSYVSGRRANRRCGR